MIINSAQYLDFMTVDALQLTPTAIQIIEQNLEQQIGTSEKYKEIMWEDRLVTQVGIYRTADKEKKLRTKIFTYNEDATTQTITITNEDDGTTVVTILE